MSLKLASAPKGEKSPPSGETSSRGEESGKPFPQQGRMEVVELLCLFGPHCLPHDFGSNAKAREMIARRSELCSQALLKRLEREAAQRRHRTRLMTF